ncbi:hypothetical protein [Spirosoma pollinicola]|uniref:Uncharacterized protein n=1 Tax=Spirosoma pollinicola TaxID=2057025 RepID=A0A2K8Z9Y2_9BACT|nr:hypothetical protein [Spirosoma pollinicola]AUD06688.1 hypothetical protein CWM47_35495 [Spirosoma pollinicola]
MRYVYLFLLASLLFCACKKKQLPQNLVSQIKDVAIYKPSPDSLLIYLVLADTANKPVAATGSYLFMLADSTRVPPPVYSDRGYVKRLISSPRTQECPKMEKRHWRPKLAVSRPKIYEPGRLTTVYRNDH